MYGRRKTRRQDAELATDAWTCVMVGIRSSCMPSPDHSIQGVVWMRRARTKTSSMSPRRLPEMHISREVEPIAALCVRHMRM